MRTKKLNLTTRLQVPFGVTWRPSGTSLVTALLTPPRAALASLGKAKTDFGNGLAFVDRQAHKYKRGERGEREKKRKRKRKKKRKRRQGRDTLGKMQIDSEREREREREKQKGDISERANEIV